LQIIMDDDDADNDDDDDKFEKEEKLKFIQLLFKMNKNYFENLIGYENNEDKV